MPRLSASLARLQQRNRAIAHNQFLFMSRYAKVRTQSAPKASLWTRFKLWIATFYRRVLEVFRAR